METPSQPHRTGARGLAHRFTHSRRFEFFIVALILFGGALLGVETSATAVERYGPWLDAGQWAVLGVFIVEAALKLFAEAPRIDRYFRDPWNVFDFSIIVLSLIPAVGVLALVARKARLLRVLRLVSAIPELRLLVTTLVRSIPGMAHIVALMSVLTYIYAIIGHQLFAEHDPTHWHNLGVSLLSLFRVVTLEDWTDIMYTAMELHTLAWLYFVSFVVLGAFVVFNLFTALIINNLDAAREERLRAGMTARSRESLLLTVHAARESLRELERRLEAGPEDGGAGT